MRSDVLVLLMVVVCGCAGSYVQPQMQTTATRLPRPPRVLVYDFAVSPDEIVEDQNVLRQFADAETDTTDSRRARTIAHDIADSMADALVARIRAMGLRAERAGRDTRVYYDDLKIEGAFLDVNQGNQLKRLVIGFGVGASRVDTEVE